MGRWKKAGEARPFDHNVVDGRVPWFTNLIRFFKPLPKPEEAIPVEDFFEPKLPDVNIEGGQNVEADDEG